MAKPLEITIFKVGKHTASNGMQYEFSLKDLQEVVSNYNPTVYRAPVIISHDTQGLADKEVEHSELSYGFPDKLKLVGDSLKGVFYQGIAEPIKSWWNDRKLHSKSASFYLPDSSSNPYPGQYSLRHIALLGKTSPAVKGLPYEEFAEFSEKGFVEFQMFTKHPNEIIAEIFQRIREYLIQEDGLETADKVIPLETLEELRESSAALATQERVDELMREIERLYKDNYELKSKINDIDYSEKDMEDNKELTERERILLEREAAFEKREVASFVEGLITSGKLTVAEKEDTITLLLSTSDTEQVSFSEQTMTPRQALMKKLERAEAWNYSEDIVPPEEEYVLPKNSALEGATPQSLKMDKMIRDRCVKTNRNPDNVVHYAEAMTELGVTFS